MSCEIQLTANFEGLDEFLESSNSDVTDSVNETELSVSKFINSKIAVSPTREIIAVSKNNRLLTFKSKWNSNAVSKAKITYSPNYEHQVPCEGGYFFKENVTSLLCLPFFSYGQSIQGGADWTCVVVGFPSGYVKFYTEALQELASIILHEEPVVEIKCYTPSLIQQGKTLKQDNNDIYVLYKTVICIFNGPNLSLFLQNRRNQLAKRVNLKINDNDVYTALDFKKYSFADQELVNDACYLGQTLPSMCNTFDHLVTASCVGGFNCNYRPSPPQSSLIITCGKKPFIGFHYTLDSGNGPLFTDVALAVASKIKSSISANLPDWFGFGGKKSNQSDKPKEIMQDAERLHCRFGLCDIWRQGKSIILSPDGYFSAVSDSLGRVILVDNATGIAQRLWKGFRDAQCGFLLVHEDVRHIKRMRGTDSKRKPRQGLFIVIYAPKKGLIEIFSTQSGRQVTTFKVSKFGRLMYNPRGCIAPNAFSRGPSLSQNQVIFISKSEIWEFFVPFHCALAEGNQMSRDLHVLKKIKLLLKTEWKNSNFTQEIEKCARELKIDEVKYQAIELLSANRNITVEAFKATLIVFIDEMHKNDSVESSKKILVFAQTMYNLLSFFEFLCEISDLPNNNKISEGFADSAHVLTEDLRIPERDLEITIKFMNQIKEIKGFKKATGKVTFEDKKSSKLSQYLTSFDFDFFLNCVEKQEISKKIKVQPCRLTLKENLREESAILLSEQLFGGILNDVNQLNEWSTQAEKCSLHPTDLVLCLLSYWCGKNSSEDFPVHEVTNLVKILKTICSLNDPNVVSVEYNSESPWWAKLRSYISSSPSTVRGLFAALCCRSVTIFIEQEREFVHKKGDKKHKFKENNDWETISKDTYLWDMLITQLQDVALLNAVLNLTFKGMLQETRYPAIPFHFEYQCLNSIQQSGSGRVSELVAKWLAQFAFNPVTLVNKHDVEFCEAESNQENVKNMEDSESKKVNLIRDLDRANGAREGEVNGTIPLDYLAVLKSRFPYSLTSSLLLCNLCWEYAAHWYKNAKNVEYLEMAMRCLEVIPSKKIKYGISYLTWNTYLEEKLKILSKMINLVGRLPNDQFCLREIGLGGSQITSFLETVGNYLKVMLQSDEDELEDFENNRETIWQNGSVNSGSSLVSIALSQPQVNADLVILQLQLINSLLLVAGLNLKIPKLHSCLFENMERPQFDLVENIQVHSHHQNQALRDARNGFLQKAIAEAVRTIQVVEYVHRPSSSSLCDTLPSTTLNVDDYKKWLRHCFDLAGVWALSLDDLRRYQICELYANGFDRLAEEILPSVNENEKLASQLLVIIGQRLKCFIQDVGDVPDQFSKLSSNLSEWLKCFDSKCTGHHNGTIGDVEVMARYVVKWLPEGHPEQNLAMTVIETVAFLSSSEF